MGYEKKLRDQAFGKFAEGKAAEHYISQGYAIRSRNWRLNKIEIDIIAQKGNVIVFIEVKARSGKGMEPADAVTMEKMRMISRGADYYLQRLTGRYEYRFDIFTLTGDFEDYTTEVYPDAFISPLVSR